MKQAMLFKLLMDRRVSDIAPPSYIEQQFGTMHELLNARRQYEMAGFRTIEIVNLDVELPKGVMNVKLH